MNTEEERAKTKAFVGYCAACKLMVAASVDTPKDKRENAKFVADLVRRGFTLGQITCADVRAAKWCGCTKASRAAADHVKESAE